jgi:hypothetical protein
MTIKIPFFSIRTCIFAALTTGLIISSLPIKSNAQLQKRMQVSVKFPPTEDLGAPSRTTGAGSRGPACGGQNLTNRLISTKLNKNELGLMALTPINNVLTTVSVHPAVYLHVPKSIDKKAEFRIIDLRTNREKVVYQITFPLVNTPGIVRVSIPETVNLEVNNRYQWQMIIICNPKDREADKIVEGWIQVMALNSEQQARLQQVKEDSIEQAQLYTEYGIWNEALIILDKLRGQNSQAQAEWVELLNSVELEKLVQTPVVSSSP